MSNRPVIWPKGEAFQRSPGVWTAPCSNFHKKVERVYYLAFSIQNLTEAQ